MGDNIVLRCEAEGDASSIRSSLQKRIPEVYNWTVSTILTVVLFFPLIVTFVSLWILSKLLQKAFKALLLQVDDKSFQLSVLVLTSLVAYYQLDPIPFSVYFSFISFLVILKWLRGSECGLLKDQVCFVIYWLNLQWIFRNLSVLGIKLHGCHPVTKCVFKSKNFLFHEGTEINPEIGWDDLGVWKPQVPGEWDSDHNGLMFGSGIHIDFPVMKGPLDFGDEHVYRIQLRYIDGLLRYSVDYLELGNESNPWRGGTDDFLIEMEKDKASRFYLYIKSLESGTALISVMDEMCHCEKMFAVAKLIKKGENFYNGSFYEERVFCGVDGFKALLKSINR